MASPSPTHDRKVSTAPASLASLKSSSPAGSPNSEKTLAERLSAPPKQLFHKKVAGYEGVKSKEASPEPPGKKTYEKPTTGFCAPGGDCTGKPRPEDLNPSPVRLSRKVSENTHKPLQGLVIGSEQRMNASVERQRELAPSPASKRNTDTFLKADNFASPGYLVDTATSSARREERLSQVRKEYPPRPIQPKAWEKDGVHPTRALNQHRGAGGAAKATIQGAADSVVTNEEIQRAVAAGAAGSGRRPDEAGSPIGGKRQAARDVKAVDHVAAEFFNKDTTESSPHIPPPLDLSKIGFGKRQRITQEKKSPQSQRRIDLQNSFLAKKKNQHLQFSARRVHAAHGPNALLKGYGSMTAVVSARARATGKIQVADAAGNKQNIDFKANNGAGTSSGVQTGPLRLTKTFHTEQRSTSFDNDFAKANHAASSDRISPTAEILLKHEARFGKRVSASPKSLKGIMSPETPRNRKSYVSSRPFGDHTNQEIQANKSASVARIGWHGASSSGNSSGMINSV